MALDDPTVKVEQLSQSLAQGLGESWQNMVSVRKQMFRALAFNILEQSREVRHHGLLTAVEALESVLCDPNSAKSWAPGLKNGIDALNFVIELEQDRNEVGANVPESLADELTAPDPYSDIKAGAKDPYSVSQDVEVCGAMHESGWSCTRPPHPPQWKHWDADREVDETSGSLHVGQIHASWFDGNDDSIEYTPSIDGEED